ncbi:MAG: inositol monophosphatase [Deltaproteobacteria bacterium]|nr:inositol monophosphatase [Deltaproteobacteria bacterium]
MDIKTLKEIKYYVEAVAVEAGKAILSFSKESLKIQFKEGASSEASSVVTDADRLSQKIITDQLLPFCKQFNLGFLAEEEPDRLDRLHKDAFFCVDPLDGTLAFTNGIDGYSVSIAIVSKSGESLLGVVYDPEKDDLYSALKNNGAFKNRLTLKITGPAELKNGIFITDKSFEKHLLYKETLSLFNDNNFTLKISQSGAVLNALSTLSEDVYSYFKFPKNVPGGGSLWDFAATSCICKEAGGSVSDILGNPIELNRKESSFLNHKGVIYSQSNQISTRIIEMYQSLNL